MPADMGTRRTVENIRAAMSPRTKSARMCLSPIARGQRRSPHSDRRFSHGFARMDESRTRRQNVYSIFRVFCSWSGT
jgi:hypothetical protein